MTRTFSLGGSVNVPGVGGVNRGVLAAVVVAGAGVIAWRYLRPSSAAADDTGAVSDFDVEGSVPGVLGAVSPTNSYGLDDAGGGAPAPGTDSYGFRGTTNDQWSQYIVSQLSLTDRWNLADVMEALGNYLTGRPMTQLQQQIVSAGIAVAGAAPVGQHTIIPGGETTIRVAPSITGITAGQSSVTIRHTLVSGASSYQVLRSGVSSPVGSGTGGTITVGGLEPNRSYTFTVRALNSSGKPGPSSGSRSAKTSAVVLGRPAKPRISSVTRSSAHASVPRVKGATLYLWYVDGHNSGKTENPTFGVHGLKPNTKHTIQVSADTVRGTAGPRSAAATFRTKK